MGPTTHPSTDEGTIQVLLVEDDERLARLTSRYLQEHGIVVTVARTGPAGLAEASRHAYDVVLLDLMLPGRDGMKVCREHRRGPWGHAHAGEPARPGHHGPCHPARRARGRAATDGYVGLASIGG